jgi:hypothetical protein
MNAWNASDETVRRSLLEACWSAEGKYVDPNVELIGREALSQHIAKIQAARPGARLEFMSGVEIHHKCLRFEWRLVRADGSHGPTSIDFGEAGVDDRPIKIIGFFGAAPPIF